MIFIPITDLHFITTGKYYELSFYYSFFIFSSIPFYEYIMIWWLLGCSGLWLLWKKLLATFTYTSLCGYLLSFLLGKYLGLKWLVNTYRWNFWTYIKCMIKFLRSCPNSKVVVPFYISISSLWDFQLLYILISICHY